MLCEVCSRDYSEAGAPITDYQRWLHAPDPCPNCFPARQFENAELALSEDKRVQEHRAFSNVNGDVLDHI